MESGTETAAQGGAKITLVQTGKVQEVSFTPGMTPKQVFAAQGWELNESNEVRLNNRILKDLDTELNDGDTLMVIGEISGG